ncbi:glycosyltransferase family 4 protein [Gillisia sp. JM1]|uniref:glycosyltransferase family 4 protein n=1 Tax=Gillisia sp. JM1 TaxID=1283286 RepID=UPI0004089008|nr:glycosyltransferase family 4 protein [Gillisia sp. JM1]
MKILLLINSLYTGGSEFSSLSLYGWLKEKHNVEIKVVCLKKANPEFNFNEFGIKEVIILQESSFLSKLKELKSLVLEFEPNILHSVLFEANILGRFLRFNTKNIIHVESLVTEMYSDFKLNDPHINRMKLEFYRLLDFITQIKGVDHYHANGYSVANHYKQKLNIGNSRMSVITRGRKRNEYLQNFKKIDQIRNEFGAGDKIILINVARHDFQKAQDVLIEAIVQLNEFHDKFLLLLVGRPGQLTSTIIKKIENFNLQDSVRILGHRSDVNELLAASDIFLFPSRFEGLSGALIEAEAAGLPIICSDISNNLEVIENNVNAITFKVDDAKDLSSKIKNLILNLEKRKSMGENSLKIYNDKFRIDQAHERMHGMFKILINNN